MKLLALLKNIMKLLFKRFALRFPPLQQGMRLSLPSTLAIFRNYHFYKIANFFEFYFFLYSRFLLVIYFMPISVYMSIPISQFITPPLPHFPPLASIRLFSISLSLFLPCKPVHLYHFSRFHIYTLIYNICFSLSDLLHSV